MEDFVTFEIAKKLKEKGFNEPCYMFYDKGGKLTSVIEYDATNSGIDINNLLIKNSRLTAGAECVAPTISQALKWLRKEKKIYIVPLIYYDWSEDTNGTICKEWLFWSYKVVRIDDGRIIYDELEENFENYEQAALAGIECVIDNLI